MVFKYLGVHLVIIKMAEATANVDHTSAEDTTLDLRVNSHAKLELFAYMQVGRRQQRK